MKSNILAFAILTSILSAIVLVLSPPTDAQLKSPVISELKTASPLRDSLAQTEPTKITGVKIVNGAELKLEHAAGAPLGQFTTSTDGKTSSTDLPNAVLALPDGKEFRVENPAGGIATITVTQVTANSVRIGITGSAAPPSVKISSDAQGSIVGFRVSPDTVADEGEIEIIARGDRKRSSSISSKTGTPLRDIPASVQIIPQTVIKNTGATTLNEAIRNSPSVQQSSQSNYGFANTYSIRGLTQSFLKDGINDGLSVNGYARTLTDVETIEILKGPGSSLFGSLSPGGTINLISKKPQSTPAAAVNFTTGSYGAYGGNVDFTGSLDRNNSLLYRFNGAYNTLDGFKGLGNSNIEILPKLTWKPNEFNTVNFSFDYRRITVDPDSFGIPFRGTELLNVPRETRFYTPFAFSTQEIYRGATTHEWQVNPNLLVRNNFAVTSRELNFARNTAGGFTTTTNPNGSVNYLTTPANRGLREQTDKNIDLTYQTEGLWKTQTGSIKHTVLAGVEYQYKKYDSVRDSVTFPAIANAFNPVLETSRSQATSIVRDYNTRQTANYAGVYLQDQIEISDRLKVRLGGRFDVFGIGRTGFVGTDTRAYAQSPSAFSYQAGLVYQPIREVSLYGGISKNYLAPISTEGMTSVFDPPESALQYEVGAKTELFDGKLALNLAFYDITRENFIITLNSIRLPIGAQKTKGVELDFNAKPSDGWSIYGGIALADAKLTNLPNTRIFEGNRPVGVPNAAASLGTSYQIQSGSLKGFGIGGGLTYRDSIFTTNDNRRSLPAYTTLDLALFYRRDDFDAQLNVYNVTDAAYFRNGSNGGGLPGIPLTVAASVGFKF